MRILLGLVLALSVSFACDQPYEEIGGYKIGCEFNDNGFLQTPSEEDGILSYVAVSKPPFDGVKLYAHNNILVKATFVREYDDLYDMNKDISSMLSRLKDRWGEFKKTEHQYQNFEYVFNDTKNDVIPVISLYELRDNDIGTVAIIYESIQYKELSKKISNKEDMGKNAVDDFGF